MFDWITGINFLALTRNSVEVLLLAVLFYYILAFFRGTRGATVLTGFVLLLVGLIVLTRLFHLDALNWLLERFSVYLAVAFLVIFQPEIRRALAELGKQNLFGAADANKSLVESMVQASSQLSKARIGALIAIERAIKVRAIKESGVALDSAVTPELIISIFFPKNPLHDGGVVIANNRIVAAGCTFPLSQRQMRRDLGTRHRAAMGLSDETDAVVIVVSEETGEISVGYRGRLIEALSEERLRKFLSGILLKSKGAKTSLRKVKEQLDLTPTGVAKTEEMSKSKEND